MKKAIDEISQMEISERELELIEKGFKMGKLEFKSKGRLYEK